MKKDEGEEKKKKSVCVHLFSVAKTKQNESQKSKQQYHDG